MHIHFQLAQQCIQISTRINSSSVHTYIFVCFTLRVILQGFVTQNATVVRSFFDAVRVNDQVAPEIYSTIIGCAHGMIATTIYFS